MPEIVVGAEHATFINTFRCEPSNQDEVVRINRDIVDHVASTFPGFIAAIVHRSTDGTAAVAGRSGRAVGPREDVLQDILGV